MILKGTCIKTFLSSPTAGVRVVLIYGPDSGQVRENADSVVKTVVTDPKDPFRVAELMGSSLSEDPARLADEADARTMTGGRRVVRVRDATDGAAVAVAQLLQSAAARAADPEDSLVVIEAGDLPGKSALRKVTEKNHRATVIACYRDEGRTLTAVIQESLSAHGLSAAPDALNYLAVRLGADRGLSRQELEKLALFMAGPNSGDTISLADAVSCVGDTANLDLDSAVMAAADGAVARVDPLLDRLFGEGVNAVQALRSLSTHLTRLHFLSAAGRAGQSLKTAIQHLRPRLFWKLWDPVVAQAPLWSEAAAERALGAVRDAEIKCKSTGYPANLVCRQTFLGVARMAASARRRR